MKPGRSSERPARTPVARPRTRGAADGKACATVAPGLAAHGAGDHGKTAR